MTVFSTAVAGGRKRRGEGHTRREEILQAAKELFLEEGYDATTIRRIADRVGISAPALYLYFRDKEALMLALCDQTFAHLIAAIGEIEKTVQDPLERIRRFGEAYARFGLSHPDEYRLVFLGGEHARIRCARSAIARRRTTPPSRAWAARWCSAGWSPCWHRPRLRASSSTIRPTPARNYAGWPCTAWWRR